MKKVFLALGAFIAIYIVILSVGFYFRGPAQVNIVAIGDSLVAGVGAETVGGFVTMLASDLRVPITNLGNSGDTTEDVLGRIEAINKYDPDIVIVLVGGNDVLSGVSDDQIFRNLGRIIDEVRKAGAEPLLLGLENNLPGKKYVERYDTLVREKKVAFIPNILSGVFGNGKYMSDALHPNEVGYEIVAEKVSPKLRELILFKKM